MISSDTGTESSLSGGTKEGSSSAFWLLCRVASNLCAFPVSHVVEAMRPMAVETVAGVPAPMLGLSVIRGVPTPVVDAGWLFDGRATQCERFVVVRAGERTVALAVDEIAGIRFIDAAEWQPLPRLMGDAHAMSALKALDDELAFFVEAARVCPDNVLRALPGGGA